MRGLVALVMAFVLPACSNGFVRRQSQLPPERYASECSSTSSAPVADTALGVAGVLLVFGGVGLAASDPIGSDHENGGASMGVVAVVAGVATAVLGISSAHRGYSEIARCREARDRSPLTPVANAAYESP
jgi:hypothetical protein